MYEQSFHKGDISGTAFLVTGGAGFIGSHIVEYLLKHGAGKVRVLDNLATGRESNVEIFEGRKGYEFLNGDITDLDTCRKACEGIDYVLHQAALGSVPRSLAFPERTNAANVDGFVNMLVAAKDSKVKRVVYASSSSVYGDSQQQPKVEEVIGKQISPYAVSKYTNELYAHVFHLNYGLEIMGLRYFNVFGPRQNPKGEYAAVIPKFIFSVMNNEAVFIDGDGDQSRDFTFVENAVQANIRALFTEDNAAIGQIFNVAVGETYSVNDLFNGITEYLGSAARPTYRETRKGDVKSSLANISKAQNLLSYSPQVKFKDGLIQTIEYFKSL
jgi:UDP-N-acetylglucosamine 4-epimerase